MKNGEEGTGQLMHQFMKTNKDKLGQKETNIKVSPSKNNEEQGAK